MSDHHDYPWKFSTIGKELELQNGFGFKPEHWKESGTPIIRIQNLNDRTAAFDYVQHAVDKQFQVKRGDLLFAWSGSRGTSFGPFIWDQGDAVLNQHIFNVRPRHEWLDKPFCYWWLKSLVAEIEQQAHGSAGLVHITRRELEKFRFPVLQIIEQRKIANILTTVNNLIEKAESLIAKYQAIKQGMMYDLFTRGVDTHGHLRPSQAETPELYKPSELGWIPKDWATPTFDDITPPDAPICYGIVQPGGHDEHGISVLAIWNLKGDFRDVHRCSRMIEAQYARSRIRGGDVLLSVKGTTGRVDIAPDWFHGNISRDIARIRPTSNVSSEYLRQLLESPHFQAHLNNAIVGSTRAELSIKVLRRLRLIVPLEQEQKHIANSLRCLDVMLATMRRHISNYRCLKSGLMQDLLTGKVRVKVDEEALAHV